MTEGMTRRDREDLAKLARRREKLAKQDVAARGAALLADFEKQVASQYKTDDDEVWDRAYRMAQDAIREANRAVAERCRELGIAEGFAPSMGTTWFDRGRESAKERVTELRRVAKSRIEAKVREAQAEIERRSLNVQEHLIAGGLGSDEARAFLDAMPTAEELLPVLTVADVQAALEATGLRDRRRRLGS